MFGMKLEIKFGLIKLKEILEIGLDEFIEVV